MPASSSSATGGDKAVAHRAPLAIGRGATRSGSRGGSAWSEAPRAGFEPAAYSLGGLRRAGRQGTRGRARPSNRCERDHSAQGSVAALRRGWPGVCTRFVPWRGLLTPGTMSASLGKQTAPGAAPGAGERGGLRCCFSTEPGAAREPIARTRTPGSSSRARAWCCSHETPASSQARRPPDHLAGSKPRCRVRSPRPAHGAL
jgi:hypothetical protein